MKKGYFKASLAFLVAGFLAKGDWSGFQETFGFSLVEYTSGFPCIVQSKVVFVSFVSNSNWVVKLTSVKSKLQVSNSTLPA